MYARAPNVVQTPIAPQVIMLRVVNVVLIMKGILIIWA